MSQIRIERVPVNLLGLRGFDHMQLVFEPTVTNPQWPQDEWLVIEGVFDPAPEGQTLGVIGGNGDTTLPEANGGRIQQDLVDLIGTPDSRGSVVIATAQDPFNAFQTMAAYGNDIDSQRLPYYSQLLASRTLANINSSSVVATLLYVIGVDIESNLPIGLGRSPGWKTFIGTSNDDNLTLEGSFEALFGGLGNDRLAGTDRAGITERFYGGAGDDIFTWSEGDNIFHGGQLNLAYEADGRDLVDYTGVGSVFLELNPAAIDHRAPEIIATRAGGTDFFLSIELIRLNPASDEVTFGPGLDGILERLFLDLGDQASLGEGDRLDFSQSDDGIRLIAGTDSQLMFAQGAASTSADDGLWVQSAEWIVGSGEDDTAYVAETIRGFEAADGNDLIDARLVDAFNPESPLGYDIEIYGGQGDDTIVSGEGTTYANGGPGNDTFVLSALTAPGATTVEFVIEGAEAGDQLYVPYNFFTEPAGAFDDSSLLPLLGAMAQLPGQAGFASLPENQGPFTTPGPRSDFFAFTWQTENDQFFNDDQTDGVIDFTGAVLYNREGSDLLIHLFSGASMDVPQVGANGTPYTLTVNIADFTTETIIRVTDFQDGDLGIQFYDPGDATVISYTRDHGSYTALSFANWDAAVAAMTNNGVFADPLPLRPELPAYDPADDLPPDPPNIIIGSLNDDIIVTPDGNQSVNAGDGNDTVTTQSGDDTLDGGSGADDLTGGDGNDTYIVDDVADVVNEAPGQGNDTVIASVSYVLPDNVENLTLTAAASGAFATFSIVTVLDGTGNALRNRLIGNDESNALSGLAGNDTLYGALGDDHLIGGAGNDVYLYYFGDGNDLISDFGGASDFDTLILDGVTASDVSFYRVASAPDDLIISLLHGGRLQIESYFDLAGDSHGIERVRILGEEDWTRAEIDSLVALTGILSNEAPQARDDEGFVLAGPNATIQSADLLANDSDFDADPLTIIAVTTDNPDVTASITPDGNISLSGPSDSETATTLTYTISDGQGGTASAITAVVLYPSPNRAPEVTAVIANQSIAEDTAWSFTVPETVFSDPDLDPLTYSATLADGQALPAWMAFDAATRTFTATPPQDFNGDIALSVTASDGALSASAGFTLEITPVNDAPVASDDAGFETAEDTPLTLSIASLLANDIDVDQDPLDIVAVSNASNGTAALDGAGNIVFTPNPGYEGPASFSYTLDDGNGGSDTANVMLTVNPSPGSGILTGTTGSDYLIGTAEADIFNALAGNDTMFGGAGDDIFLGDAGHDIMLGGAGHDTVDYSASDAGVSIRLWFFATQSGGDAQGDRLISIETVIGSSYDDVIRGGITSITAEGGAGNDVLTGGLSGDRLDGGSGADTLAGGYGDDTFVFRDGYGSDTITDFSTSNGWLWFSNNDQIELSVTSVDTFSDLLSHAGQIGGDVVFDFGNGDQLTLANIQLSQLQSESFIFA